MRVGEKLTTSSGKGQISLPSLTGAVIWAHDTCTRKRLKQSTSTPEKKDAEIIGPLDNYQFPVWVLHPVLKLSGYIGIRAYQFPVCCVH